MNKIGVSIQETMAVWTDLPINILSDIFGHLGIKEIALFISLHKNKRTLKRIGILCGYLMRFKIHVKIVTVEQLLFFKKYNFKVQTVETHDYFLPLMRGVLCSTLNLIVRGKLSAEEAKSIYTKYRNIQSIQTL